MKILIVNGWTKEGDQNHVDAGCNLQRNVFSDLIKSLRNKTNVDFYNSYGLDKLEPNDYDAFVWTGSGNNIYELNPHNQNQIEICQNILKLKKPIWGSCWGMQVITVSLGGKVARSGNPEFGLARNIRIINKTLENSIYKDKPLIFDAPAHHSDVIAEVPDTFQVIAKNDRCIQSMYSREKRIFCTQYHPELPYDYLAKMMRFWIKNYRKYMNLKDFNHLIKVLDEKEKKESKVRILEFKNWLNSIE